MSVIVKDRVKQISSTNGTGIITFSSTPAGYQSFSSAFNDGDEVYYVIENKSDYEIGVGTYNAGTLSRDTVLKSTNGNAKLSLTGRSTVFVSIPAQKSVYLDGVNKASIDLGKLSNVTLTTPASGEGLLFNGTSWTNGNLTGYTDEQAQDAVGNILVGSTGINIVYNDGAPSITISATGLQPLDGDLTSLAAATGTNTIYYRSASDTWSPVVIGTGISFSGGTLSNTLDLSSYITSTGVASTYVPYSGATTNVNLGSNSLTAGAGTFNGTVSAAATATTTSPGFFFNNRTTLGINSHTNGWMNFIIGGVNVMSLHGNSDGMAFTSGSWIGWSNHAADPTSPMDVTWYRGGVGILEQRAGTTAQQFNLFGTNTSTTNREYLKLRGVAGANFEIGPANGSAGGTLRGLTIGGYANDSATITPWLTFTNAGAATFAGNLSIGGTVTFTATTGSDYGIISQTGQNIIFGRFSTNTDTTIIGMNSNVGGAGFTIRRSDKLNWSGSTSNAGAGGTTAAITSNSNGVITFDGAANGTFSRVNWGGDTSSFPSIKRNGTSLNFRLADDSGDASITAGGITFSGQFVNALGTITSSTPATFTQTWNNVATTFSALRIDVTDTTSASGSLLQDWKTGGSSKVSLRKDGQMIFYGYGSGLGLAQLTGYNSQWFIYSGGTFQSPLFNCNGWFGMVDGAAGGVQFFSGHGIVWSGTGTSGLLTRGSLTGDVGLYRGGAGIIEQRYSTTAQSYLLYNTYSSSTNNESFKTTWVSNEARMGTAVGSAGGTQRSTVIGTWNAAGTWSPTLTVASTGTATFDATGAVVGLISRNTASNPVFELRSGAPIVDFSGVGISPNVTTSTCARWAQNSSANGGSAMLGFTANSATANPLFFVGYFGSASPTAAGLLIQTWKTDGGTGRSAIAATEKIAEFAAGSTVTFTMLGGGASLTPIAATSGVQTGFTYTGPSSTGQTASTEATEVLWTMPTKTWAAGALTTQRFFRITAPTIAFASASTITSAATLSISNAPVAGTNATITNAYALWVEAGKSQFGGDINTMGSVVINTGSQSFNTSYHFVNWNGACIGWASGGTVNSTSSLDTAFKRSSAGVVEVNNGTAGTYADLIVRNLRMSAPTTVPATAASSGSEGQIAWDADYIYICTATNTWKRVAIDTWVTP